MATASSHHHPERIGPYRILQVLGEGGMGIVYEAEQLEPVRRRVAVKVIKLGMDTREVVARFEAERQALAVMSHPGIAQVLDGGETEEGRPYFVMELVKGVPFNEYCDNQQLSIRDRVALFIGVAQAVQHAHQKGVIHRDLKPSNILVTEHDSVPATKVIDFGIAKAISQPLTDKTLVTAYGMALGTLAYMSPEQAEFSNLDIDTRSDIYSLGVMLFEVLVGELPVDPGSMGAVPFLAQLVGRVSEPARPSTRMTTSGRAKQLARLRNTDSGHLRKQLRGDLDWIVVKAMEKERNRRYDTANALAMDLERYLRNEPVLARSPSAFYRFGKFARRNRIAVAAGAVVLTSLVAGVIISTSALARARRDAATAEEVSNFLTGIFTVSDPSEARGNSITAREVLDSAAARIQRELDDQPLVKSRLMLTIAGVYNSLGLPTPAEPLLDSALAIRERELGPDAPEVADVLVEKAKVVNARGDDSTGRMLGRRAVAIYERAYGPDALEVARGLEVMLFWAGSPELANQDARILRIRRKHLAADDPVLGESNIASATGMRVREAPDSAEAHYRAGLAILQRRDKPGQVRAIAGLADLASTAGRHDTALALYDQAVQVGARFYAPDSPRFVELLSSRAIGLARAKRLPEAEAAMRETIRMVIDRLGPDAFNIDWQYAMLQLMLVEQGKYAEAADVSGLKAGVWARRGKGWADNVTATKMEQVILLAAAGKHADARAMLAPLMQIVDTSAGRPPRWAMSAHYAMARQEAQVGAIENARRHFTLALDLLRRDPRLSAESQRLGGWLRPRPIVLAEMLEEFAAVERRGGQASRADAMLAEAARARSDLLTIGIAFRESGMADSALSNLRAAVAKGQLVIATDDQPLSAAMTELARAEWKFGDRKSAIEHFTQLVQLAERNQPPSRDAATRLGILLGRQARLAAVLRRDGQIPASTRADAASGAAIDAAIAGEEIVRGASAAALNAICWWGSLAGHGGRVIGLCDAAIAAADSTERGRFLDSRAVARATSGDFAGAITDFEGYLKGLPDPAADTRRQEWLTALRAKRNPLTRDELDRLIGQ